MKRLIATTSIVLLTINASIQIPKDVDQTTSNEVLDELYQQYLSEFRSTSHSTNYDFENFKANILKIQEHNKRNQQYKQGINQFTGLKLDLNHTISDQKSNFSAKRASIQNNPTFWDWRTRRIIGEVKDQGQTDEGWIYASISAVESKYALKYNQNISLSLQQIRDCNKADVGSQAAWTVFYQIANSGGIALKESYPDTTQNQSCYFNLTVPGVQTFDMGYDWVVNEDETVVQQFVMNNGPVAAGFRVSDDFKTYSSGVYYSTACDSELPTHTILIIGWGTENGIDYWLIQNSWGTSWGEQGYAKIQRGVNTCSIADYGAVPSEVYDPTIDKKRPFQIHYFNFDSGARCLDGSMYAIYFQPGWGDGRYKSVAYFEGGAWCGGYDSDQVLQSCVDRSKTDLGSSMNYPTSADYDYVFPSDQENDQFFYNWNKFVIKYCDGGRHQSYREQSVSYKNTTLWFRGHYNVINTMNWIGQVVPTELTTNFALIGCSAGGLATFMWADQFKDFISLRNPDARYFAFPDSAFYIVNVGDYWEQMKALFQTVNEIDFPNTKCASANSHKQYECFITENLIQFIDSPLFIVQSAYDSFQIPNMVNVNCYPLYNCNETQMQKIENYRSKQQRVIKERLSNKTNSAIWSISCSFHCLFQKGKSEVASLFQVPNSSGITIAAALQMFLAGEKDEHNWIWQDNQPWPMNTDCAFWGNDNILPQNTCHEQLNIMKYQL